MMDSRNLSPSPTNAAAFKEAVEHTRRRSPASFDQWFAGVQFEGFDGAVLSLAARDEFVRYWVRAHFVPDLIEALCRLLEGERRPYLRKLL